MIKLACVFSRASRFSGSGSFMISSFVTMTLIGLISVLVGGNANAQTVEPGIPYIAEKTITVGVRGDARPFSYLSGAQADETLLPGYSGYMIEICRRVLAEMTTSGPFAGYKVVPHVVTTAGRLSDLDAGKIDMLCGPDSITLGRLYKYNTSHPLFLSGITYATVGNALYPPGRYCGAVLGLVAGTTAESEGLRKIAESNALQRYDSALDAFLVLYANREEAKPPSRLQNAMKIMSNTLKQGFATEQKRARGEDRVDPALVIDKFCPSGFEHGPVVFYDTHREGIEDLCEGRILFYIADVDILSDRLSTCDVILQRETMTREAYGVFFRRSTHDLAKQGKPASADYFPDSALYAEFNNVLIRKMQTTENILDYEFANEFKSETPTRDLQNFFDGYKFVVDY
ncbi:MAG: substrate-binding periplasmic protein [Granulosicoccus sp.]